MTSTPVPAPPLFPPQSPVHGAISTALAAVATAVAAFVVMLSGSGTPTDVGRVPLPAPVSDATCPGAPPNAAW